MKSNLLADKISGREKALTGQYGTAGQKGGNLVAKGGKIKLTAKKVTFEQKKCPGRESELTGQYNTGGEMGKQARRWETYSKWGKNSKFYLKKSKN